MTDTVEFRYRAFLSYSHRDTSWAKWLHAALEGYRIDKDLIGRETPLGPVPKTLRPIFRDREDFSAGHSLNDQTAAALDTSQFVVVICSPNAARSPYVNEEIRRYKAAGRGNYVIPIIVDGEPGDPARDCFPPALRFKIGPDGAITDEREEPIAADARPQGDGKDGAKLKLVAGLLGVGLDEIVRREERARRRRLRNWVGALSVLTLTFAGLAVYADIERRLAVQTLNVATDTSNRLIYDLALRFRRQIGVPSSLVRDLLGRAQQLQQQLTASGQTSAALRASEASALSETALTLLGIGDRAGAAAAIDRSRQILEDLVAKYPDNAGYQSDLSVDYQRIGDTLASAGKTDEALAEFEKARAMQEKLVARKSPDEKWQNNLAVSEMKIGRIAGNRGKLDDALAAFQKSVAIREALVKHDGRNADWWRDLGVSYEAVGGVFARQHKLDQALFAFRKRLEIAQALADRLPDNTRFQRDLSVANNKVADMLLAQGKAEDALSAYRKALAIRQKLAASDPDNATWQRDVAISNNEIGIALTQENKLDEALAAFQQGLAIERKLVAKDRNNTEWQRDLYLSDITIGQTLARQRKLDAALKDFRDGAAVATAELKAHPGDGNWQNMLQYGAEQIGALSYSLVLNREFPLALEAADQAISLSPKTLWFYSNRAHALMFAGRTDEARALYLKYRGQKNVFQQKSWDTVIAEDFAELRKVGLTNPLMDEIAKQLTDGG